MRTKDFRRKQIAKHFNRRVELYSLYGDFGMSFDANKADEIPKYYKKYGKLQNKPVKTKNRVKSINETKNKKWAKKLKNGDVKLTLIDKQDRRYCNRVRRHFQKLVDYKLPDKIFLDRCQVIYPREIN